MGTEKELQSETQYQTTHQVLNRQGYKIHYYINGHQNKETILFLHPAFSDHTCFNHQIDFFSKNFRVITMDMLGHGLSDAGKSKDKIDVTSNHINEILEKENIKQLHIVGVSMGSLMAQNYAWQYPEKTLSLTVLGGYSINQKNKEIRKSQCKESFKWLLKILFSMNSFRKYTGTVSAIKKEEQDNFYKSTQGFSRKSFRVMPGLDNLIIGKDTIFRNYPLQILIGEKDIDFARKIANDWHKQERSSFHIIENAGHCANMDNPEMFNRILLDFIH